MELVSPHALNKAVAYRGFTNRTLADACGRRSLRSTIGHLRSGARRTCGADVARKIELALDVPPGSLFLLKVATGSYGRMAGVRR